MDELEPVRQNALIAYERESTWDLPVVVFACLPFVSLAVRDLGSEGDARAHDGALLDDVLRDVRETEERERREFSVVEVFGVEDSDVRGEVGARVGLPDVGGEWAARLVVGGCLQE